MSRMKILQWNFNSDQGYSKGVFAMATFVRYLSQTSIIRRAINTK